MTSQTILIGSAALEAIHPGASKRPVKDMDLLVMVNEEENIKNRFNKLSGLQDLYIKPIRTNKVETFFVTKGSPYAALFKELTLTGDNKFFSMTDWSYETDHFMAIASLDTLYTLKMAHRYRKNYPHFLKTIYDIKLLRSLGAKIVDEDWYRKLEKWNYRYAVPKLKGESKNAFFKQDQGVRYLYDHDDLHEAVKIGPKPAYTFYKKDGQEVECSKELFDKLPYETRLNGVVEEAMVLALERSIIPYMDKFNADIDYCRNAYAKALEKVCTSITSGWFREFAWENYFQALNSYPENFYIRFKQLRKDGKIRRKINHGDKNDK